MKKPELEGLTLDEIAIIRSALLMFGEFMDYVESLPIEQVVTKAKEIDIETEEEVEEHLTRTREGIHSAIVKMDNALFIVDQMIEEAAKNGEI